MCICCSFDLYNYDSYRIALEYIDAICKYNSYEEFNEIITHIDSQAQVKEMCKYSDKLDWISKNAAAFRQYLNSIKSIVLIYRIRTYTEKNLEFTYDVYKSCVDLYKEGDSIIRCIFKY